MDTDINLQELCNWIDKHSITRQKKNLNRDFSDGLPLAEILKYHFPRWVDLHNYAPKNSVSKKIDNWVTLNRKVLYKLDIQLTDTEMLSIAKCTPGAIENLMHRIKTKVEEYEKEEELAKESKTDVANGDYSKKSSKLVPIELLEDQALKLEEKNEAIEVLNQKINHLQNLLDIKDERIKELQQKLEEYLAKETASVGFFNRFMK